MRFFAVNGERPVRLSEETRLFAYESLNHKYGKETWETPYVVLDDYEGFESLSVLEKYDVAIEQIAKTAPIRICKGEKISGAATLGFAIAHALPAMYKGEIVSNGCSSYFTGQSHLTADFETVLKKGVRHIEELAEQSLIKYKGTEKEPFIQSCLRCLNSMKVWHERYLNSLKDMPEYADNYEHLKNVPFQPAKNFREAVQSLWFSFAFLRLCGNWPGLGRLDWLLGEYLEKDLADGTLTLDEAREILAHFFIKGCEWIRGGDHVSGDAQHYQNILLGGIDEDGKEVTNQVTYLALDVIEELGIGDFPTSMRINKNTDEKLLKRVAEVIRLGGGVLAVYNEDLVIDSLTSYGYELKEARKFANDGCWEVQVPGKTNFGYLSFDSLQVLQTQTLNDYNVDEEHTYSSFEELYNQYVEDLRECVKDVVRTNCEYEFLPDDFKKMRYMPCTLIALFERGCIEKGLPYHEFGPIYNVKSPHIGGLPDTVNSLYAIKKLVFEEKKVSFEELMEILKDNWDNNEPLRQYVLNKYEYYGNDNDEADAIAQRIIEDFADICDETNKDCEYATPAGISTFGRQLGWASDRFATPYGKKAHEVLSGNFSPTPGTDKEGATAIIKSYCKVNLKRMVTGAALDVKLLPSAVKGENGLEAIISLIKGFVTLGGHFMQLDIADTELLKEAQEHPEDHQNLSVRVSGWNARFVTLNKEWQDMIISQTGSDF